MISITANKRIKLWAVAVWLILWQLASMAIGQEILLVSPVVVLVRLGALIRTGDFWMSILLSFLKIIGGFLLGITAGTLLAVLSARFRWIGDLLEPFVQTVKAIPVASFVILVLIWIPSRNLSIVITFLMVFPIIYTNVCNGLGSMDSQLLEMAEVFRLSPLIRIRYIYVSQVLPFFRAGCSLALGLCWKAGVAAEVIGIPDHSIGEKLYEAKIYLNTPDLFAWTLVIIIISVVFEKVFLKVIDGIVGILERMG